jgi:cytochrome c-type biogenesis protein CcmH
MKKQLSSRATGRSAAKGGRPGTHGETSRWVPARAMVQHAAAAVHRLAGMTIWVKHRNYELAVLLALYVLFQAPAFAVTPDEMLADPKLEARARAIGKELRCLQCQNESIDDSNAPLAHDLRVLVRQRLVNGDSDAAVKQYVVARYGTYVLLKPPFEAETYALWFGPLLLLAAGGAAVFLFYRRRSTPPAPLSDEERRRLASLQEPP